MKIVAGYIDEQFFISYSFDETSLNFQVTNSWAQEGSEEYISGSIKWDGCANIDFGLGDGSPMHFCEKSHVQDFSRILEYVYNLAIEKLNIEQQ